MTTSSNPTQIKRVLFICSANSFRSQIAEGYLRHFYPDRYDVYSAGIHDSYVHPKAIRLMAELGIDISIHTSNSVTEFRSDPFDIAVTVCENAKEVCPPLPNVTKILHWPYPDPTNFFGSPDDALNYTRKIRDEIGAKIKGYFL